MKKKLLGMATLTALTIGLTSCGGTVTHTKDELIQECNSNEFQTGFEKEFYKLKSSRGRDLIGVNWDDEKNSCIYFYEKSNVTTVKTIPNKVISDYLDYKRKIKTAGSLIDTVFKFNINS